MSINGLTFIQRFEEHFPLELAEPGDPVGLHIGQLDRPIEKIMFTLDVRPEVVAEAIANNVDLLVAKHPPIFRPITRLDFDDEEANMYAQCIKHDIAVYAAHTNMDIVEDGLNDWLLSELGIESSQYLKKTHDVAYQQVEIHLPMAHKVTVLSRLALLTNEVISEASPEVGEVVITLPVLETEVAKITNELTHWMSELDLTFYWQPASQASKDFGIGRLGELAEPMDLTSFTGLVKDRFHLDGLRLISNEPTKMIKKVAICGGSGEKFYRDALAKGADVYITGDVYYHTGHYMLTAGLSVIDPGHHIEVLCQEKLLELAEIWQEENNWNVSFCEATTNTNPFCFY